jgi:hypothetical protein
MIALMTSVHLAADVQIDRPVECGQSMADDLYYLKRAIEHGEIAKR